MDPTLSAPADIDAEEAALAFERFSINDSWWLGCWVRDYAIARNLPIAVEIRRAATTLFSCLTPGASQDNFEWIRRKIAVVMRFERSSYAIGKAFRDNPDIFEHFGLDKMHHVADGGAVPIRIIGTGVIGAIAVSGLPQEEDHAVAVDALRALRQHQTTLERTGSI